MGASYRDHVINLLDTPGHRDFSEDTYRVLAAADAAIMVLDAAKGIEPQTLKLFEVCRSRNLPVLTCSGHFERGMVLTHQPTATPFSTKYAASVFGSDRDTIDHAWSGESSDS